MLRQALIRVPLCFSYVAVKLISQLYKHYLRALIPINTKSISGIKRGKSTEIFSLVGSSSKFNRDPVNVTILYNTATGFELITTTTTSACNYGDEITRCLNDEKLWIH